MLVLVFVVVASVPMVVPLVVVTFVTMASAFMSLMLVFMFMFLLLLLLLPLPQNLLSSHIKKASGQMVMLLFAVDLFISPGRPDLHLIDHISRITIVNGWQFPRRQFLLMRMHTIPTMTVNLLDADIAIIVLTYLLRAVVREQIIVWLVIVVSSLSVVVVAAIRKQPMTMVISTMQHFVHDDVDNEPADCSDKHHEGLLNVVPRYDPLRGLEQHKEKQHIDDEEIRQCT
jgi:hypothetical protein